MYISNNDGSLNTNVIPERDILILMNTMTRLGRGCYSDEEIERLLKIAHQDE